VEAYGTAYRLQQPLGAWRLRDPDVLLPLNGIKSHGLGFRHSQRFAASQSAAGSDVRR
jgi:hypothetical protein